MRHLADVEAHRRTNCAEYKACLEVAAVRDWDGFSCRACKVRRTLSDDERLRDAPRLELLAQLIPWLNEPPANDNTSR